MKYLHIGAFGKSETCPPTSKLWLYVSAELPAREREEIAAHLAVCDFCGAEAELLRKNPPRVMPLPNAEIPSHLKNLAAEILGKR
jgi:anti-sigma factor RsiW